MTSKYIPTKKRTIGQAVSVDQLKIVLLTLQYGLWNHKCQALLVEPKNRKQIRDVALRIKRLVKKGYLEKVSYGKYKLTSSGYSFVYQELFTLQAILNPTVCSVLNFLNEENKRLMDTLILQNRELVSN
jgi:hypothetical protein